MSPGVYARRFDYDKARQLRAEGIAAGVCRDCGGSASRFSLRDTPRCKKCANVAARTSVRDGQLHCAVCGEWKPDSLFPLSRAEPGRRGRHGSCRACLTAAKRAYREARKIPCVACGSPRLPATPGNGAHGTDTGLCRTCYLTSVKAVS